MKKINFLGSVLIFATLFPSCTSLGLFTKKADSFVGKTEDDLVKYFKYEGESVSANEEFDKAMYFSNKVTTVYMDKTTVQKFKNKKSIQLSSFSFKELSDGCLLNSGTVHYATVKRTEDGPGGTRVTKVDATHKNDNTAINAQIKSFNANVQQYNAVKSTNDEAMFNRTSIGNSYYIYSIESNSGAYSDEKVGNSTATYYTYTLKRVDVFEDSKSTTDTKTAYIHNYQQKKYFDSDNKEITEKQATSNKSNLASSGYTEREKTKGMSLIAYIKDGVVMNVEEVE